jgi:hypothetical protein
MPLPFERRRIGQTRLPVRVPAVTEAIGLPGGPARGNTENLSSGGMLLRLGRTLVPGAPVRVTLRLSRRPPLCVTGAVVWVESHPDVWGWVQGIRFSEELSAEMVAEIADAEYPPWRALAR